MLAKQLTATKRAWLADEDDAAASGTKNKDGVGIETGIPEMTMFARRSSPRETLAIIASNLISWAMLALVGFGFLDLVVEVPLGLLLVLSLGLNLEIITVPVNSVFILG
jgi:hypothetical protein